MVEGGPTRRPPPPVGCTQAKDELEVRAEQARRGICVVVGANGPDGWQVALMAGGQSLAVLEPTAARKLAGDITLMADICDRRLDYGQG